MNLANSSVIVTPLCYHGYTIGSSSANRFHFLLTQQWLPVLPVTWQACAAAYHMITFTPIYKYNPGLGYGLSCGYGVSGEMYFYNLWYSHYLCWRFSHMNQTHSHCKPYSPEISLYKLWRPEGFFSLWNHQKCLSQLSLIHLNTYGMGLRPF